MGLDHFENWFTQLLLIDICTVKINNDFLVEKKNHVKYNFHF